jgi:hypothetical protein
MLIKHKKKKKEEIEVGGVATQEAEIGRIIVQGHPGKKVSETLISTNKLGL